MEEVIFTIQGVIHSKDLPPVKTKPRSVVNMQWDYGNTCLNYIQDPST